MNSLDIVSAPVKPKIFRPPAALLSASVESAPLARPRKMWRLGVAVLVVILVWPVFYFAHSLLKSTASPQGHEALEGILPPVSDAQAALPAEKPPTILLRGKSEAIIGQMARIPMESEPIVEVKAASAVDNNTSRELLSIVSKY